MTYQVTRSEFTNPAKPPYLVDDGTLNNQTSLSFVGRGYKGFAPIIANDLLHLLENFSNHTAPLNPIEGQLWYDNSSGSKLLKVYDGSTWNEAGSIKKSSQAPLVSNSVAGDVWIDTTNSQLYLFSGSSWLLVGPQFSAGLRTGPNVETIIDTSTPPVSHSVITFYAASTTDAVDHIIAIISKDTFTPKSSIPGFTTINEGFNLSSINSTNTSSLSRIWGTASSADSLMISNSQVLASNFLRSDVSSQTNFPLSVKHDGGISIGASSSFNISAEPNTTVMYSNSAGNSLDFRMNNAGTFNTVLHLGAASRIGVGTNNTSPLSTLDVAGGITVRDDTALQTATPGRIIVTGTSDVGATSVGINDQGGASIQTMGGLSVAKKATFGDTVTANGQLLVNNLDSNGAPVAAAVILPGTDSAANLYDIGSSARPFRNIVAQAFVGNFTGAFTGTFNGSINGTAGSLANPTAFSLTGDVTSNIINFKGNSSNGQATFVTAINEGIITTKTAATDSLLTDRILVQRANVGLVSMTKQVFLNHVATVPVGSIMPYAGNTPPPGYLFCDGSEVKITDYLALNKVIGYTYKALALLQGQGTFALPDLRGRFPLGRDNMDNHLSVPSKDGSGTLVTTGGGVANRVTDITASTTGTGSGAQAVTVSTATTGSAAGTNLYALSKQAYNVMNPYLTINYIIFTGVI